MGSTSAYDHRVSVADPIAGPSWDHVDELLAPLEAAGPVPPVAAPAAPGPSGGAPSASDQAYGAAAGHPTLRFGACGDGVVELQTRLNRGGEALAIDGVFGAKTHAAVVRFQAVRGLARDGVVGRNTWEALERVEGVDATVADRVLETLDRNGDTTDTTTDDAPAAGNLLGAPKPKGLGHQAPAGVTPDKFKQEVDEKDPGAQADSASDFGQKLWGHAISGAVCDEAKKILASGDVDGILAGFSAVAVAVGKINAAGQGVAPAVAKASALAKKILAAKGLSAAQIAALVKLATPNGPNGAAAFRALWNGYDTVKDPHGVPAQYRSLGAAIQVKKYEAQACAEVTGIAAQRYYKHGDAPHDKTSFKGKIIASNALRYTEHDQGDDRMLGDVVQYKEDLGAVQAGVCEALAAGYFVQAHVLSGSCYGDDKEAWNGPTRKGTDQAGKTGDALGEHWLLIIGFDGAAFDAWNPSGAGGSFRKLYAGENNFSTAKLTSDFYVNRSGQHVTDKRHRYQVVNLQLIGAAGGKGKSKGKTASLEGGAPESFDHHVEDDGLGEDHAIA